MKKYAVKYKDKYGKEDTEIYSDGSIMHLILRTIKFEGVTFEGLEGEIDKNKFDYIFCEKGIGDLTNFELKITIPITVVRDNEEEIGTIIAFIKIEEKISTVNLKFATKFGVFSNSKDHEWFEDALLSIQQELPDNAKIKTCLSCKYSSYHPAGNSMYGGLNCFKNLKKELKTVNDKTTLMNLWNIGLKENKSFYVQETFDCKEHKFVTKNCWLYKDWKH